MVRSPAPKYAKKFAGIAEVQHVAGRRRCSRNSCRPAPRPRRRRARPFRATRRLPPGTGNLRGVVVTQTLLPLLSAYVLNKMSDGVTGTRARPVGTPIPEAIVPIKSPVCDVELHDRPVAGLARREAHQEIAVRIQQQRGRDAGIRDHHTGRCRQAGQIDELAEARRGIVFQDLVMVGGVVAGIESAISRSPSLGSSIAKGMMPVTGVRGA